jgi:hypothetical protein
MNKTPEEEPREEIAKKVITKKRQYFMPGKGKSVEAASIEEAINKVTEKDEDKDVNN